RPDLEALRPRHQGRGDDDGGSGASARPQPGLWRVAFWPSVRNPRRRPHLERVPAARGGTRRLRRRLRVGEPAGHDGIAGDSAEVTRISFAIGDLLDESALSLGEGGAVLRGFARELAAALVAAVDEIAAVAPFRNMVTPGGFRMSVAMTNCGCAGWVTDRKGYRYAPDDPITGRPWPPIPALFRRLAANAAAAAGYP